MSLIPYPSNEETRLKLVRSLRLMESDFQAELNQAVKLAADLLNCPIALISLVEENFQWFTAKCGLEQSKTSREDAFCAHAITSADPFVVPDAAVDPRFSGNPLVIGKLGIRFYAGIPISTDGVHFLGTLCVIDKVPKQINNGQIRRLRQIASMVEGFFRANEATISARSATEELAVKTQLFEQAGEIAGIGAWQVNIDTGETHWSDEVFKTHDLEPEHRPTLDEALDYYPEHDRKVVSDLIRQTLETGNPFRFDADFVTAKGRQRRVKSIGALKAGRENGRVLTGVFMDITTEHEAQKKLLHAASHDPLTGALNRTAFLERIEEQMTKAPNEGTVMVMDLDDFKTINDTLGHEAGDHVLIEISRRIREVVGNEGFCARLGGDEFAILVLGDPDLVAQSVLAEIRKPISFGPDTLHPAASLGSVEVPVAKKSPAELFRFADIALYEAKHASKGGYLKYKSHFLHKLERRRASVEFARDAVIEQRLVAVFQPLLDLNTGLVSGAEALVRIKGHDGSLIGPAHFGEALSDPDLGAQIDTSMVDLILDEIRKEVAPFDDLQISLNAGTASLRSGRYIKSVVDLAEFAKVKGTRICLEIVETVLFDDDDQSLATLLSELSEAGVLIALDDFGTGYASLSHLLKYPIDIVKIDRSFIDGLEIQADRTAIVRALVDLGRTIGKSVTAEGVETGRQLEFLKAIGCNTAQGYKIGRPAVWGDFQQYAA